MLRAEFDEAMAPVLRRWKSFTPDMAQALWNRIQDVPKGAMMKAVEEIMFGHDSARRYVPTPKAIHDIARGEAAKRRDPLSDGDVAFCTDEQWAALKRYRDAMFSGDPARQVAAIDTWLADCRRLRIPTTEIGTRRHQERQARIMALLEAKWKARPAPKTASEIAHSLDNIEGIGRGLDAESAADAFERELRATSDAPERVAHTGDVKDDQVPF